MRYVPPYGMPEDSPYINGNPQTGVQGSIPPAEAFEAPMRELVNTIRFNNIIPSSTDLQQLARGIRSQRMNYAEDTGSVNEYSCSYDPPITTYTIGLPLHVRIRSSNTGSSTIDAGAGRALIIRPDGMQVIAGDLPAGSVANLIFDGSRFQLMNFAGRVGAQNIEINELPIPYCVDQSAFPNWIHAPFLPEVEQLFAGLIVLVKIANKNDGPTEITVNNHPRVPVFANGHGWDSKEDGSPAVRALHPGDIDRDDVKVMVFDGEAFWLEPDPPVTRAAGAVDGWVRHDAIVGPNTDGMANDPHRAWPTIQDAYDNLVTRFTGNPAFTLRIRLGIPGDYSGEVQFGPYNGRISLEGDRTNPGGYSVTSTSVWEGILCYNVLCDITGITLWCWQNSQTAGIRAWGGGTRVTLRNVWIYMHSYSSYFQFYYVDHGASMELWSGGANRCVCSARGHQCGTFITCGDGGTFWGAPAGGAVYLDCYDAVLLWGGVMCAGSSRAVFMGMGVRQSNVWGYQFIIGTHSSITSYGNWLPGNVWGYSFNYGVME